MKPLVTCTKDGWVSFAVTKDEAVARINKFNEYFNTLSEDDRQKYYGGKGASLDTYTCLLCGGQSFRPYSPDTDVSIDGYTVNPVICE